MQSVQINSDDTRERVTYIASVVLVVSIVALCFLFLIDQRIIGGLEDEGNQDLVKDTVASALEAFSGQIEHTTGTFFRPGNEHFESMLRHVRSYPHCEKFGMNSLTSPHVQSTVDTYLMRHQTTFDDLPTCSSESDSSETARYFTSSHDPAKTGISHQLSQFAAVIKTAYGLGFIAAVPPPQLTRRHNNNRPVRLPMWSKYIDLSRIVIAQGGRPKCRMQVIPKRQIPTELTHAAFRGYLTRSQVLDIQASDADVIDYKFKQMLWRQKNYVMEQLANEKNRTTVVYDISSYSKHIANCIASLLGEKTIVAHLRRGDRKNDRCDKCAYFDSEQAVADQCSSSPTPQTLGAATDPKQVANAIRTLDKQYDTLYVMTDENDPEFFVNLRKEVDMCVIAEHDIPLVAALVRQLSDNYFVFVAQRALQYQFSMQIVAKPNGRFAASDVELLNVHGCRVPWGTVPGILPNASLGSMPHQTVMTLC
jgi:hypothetical protein